MPKSYKCVECGKKIYKVSRAGKCIDCQRKGPLEAARQIREKKGPIYEKWRENLSRRIATKNWRKDPDLED